MVENSDTPDTQAPAESNSIIDMSDLAPTTTPEANNDSDHDIYNIAGVIVAIPTDFFYLDEESTTDTQVVFHCYYDSSPSITVYVEDRITYPQGLGIGSFVPTLDTDDYTQEYFDINGQIVKSCIRYSYDRGMGIGWYKDFDVLFCFDNYTVILSMTGPEEYSDMFQFTFDYAHFA